jgi:uncharacterized protein (TIGR03437 family)
MGTIGAWAQQAPIMAVDAAIGSPAAITADASGNVYFSSSNNCVFKVDRTGVLTVVAGNSVAGYTGDGGPAVNAELNYPLGLAFDGAGNLYIADWSNYVVRMVAPSGIITTAAGNGVVCYPGYCGEVTNAQFSGPQAVAFDGANDLYVADVDFNGGFPGSPRAAWGYLYKVSPNGTVSTLAGGNWCPCDPSIPAFGTPADAIPLSWVHGIVVGSATDLYVSDSNYNPALSYGGGYVFEASVNGLFIADSSGFSDPMGMAFDGAGNLYVADSGNNQVIKVTPAGTMATVAGSGSHGYSGDGGPAVDAQLSAPTGVAFDSIGNLYISDSGNQRIRKVSSDSGIITTIAGTSGLAISAVVNGASFQPGIASNSWITIEGTSLSPVTDTWANAIVDGVLPTSLDGVSVSVNGLPAYIDYVSPNQINAVAPNAGAGTVSVTVTSPGGTSSAVTAVAQAAQPALFQWGSYAVATHQDYSLAVKNGTFSGLTTVPAAPGDVIILWGTGFGPTTPSAPVGVEVPSSTTYTTAGPVTVTVGVEAAVVYGAALAPGYAGLYQVAIQIPSLANGDYPVEATVDGARSPASVLITVQQ